MAPIKAVLDTDNGLRCSCSRCGSDVTYHWYKKTDDRWERMDVTSNPMTPEVGGNYACKAKWKTSQSVMSNVHTCEFMLIDTVSLLTCKVMNS